VNVDSVRCTGRYSVSRLIGSRPALRINCSKLAASHSLRGGRPGIVVNPLFDNRAVQVVRPKLERDLRHPRRHHHPVGLMCGMLSSIRRATAMFLMSLNTTP
jgi:hypothetical protein